MAKIAEVQEVSLNSLVPYERNAKIHGKDQIQKIKDSISSFGFLSPCLIDRDYNIIAGHGRVLAARELGFETVPCVFVEGLSENERKAYILADNKLTELGGWDMATVQEELKALFDDGFDVSLTGFDFNIDKLDEESESGGGNLDRLGALPESRVFVVGISAFGVDAETFIEAKLEQGAVDHLLSRFDEIQASDVIARLQEAIYAL